MSSLRHVVALPRQLVHNPCRGRGPPSLRRNPSQPWPGTGLNDHPVPSCLLNSPLENWPPLVQWLDLVPTQFINVNFSSSFELDSATCSTLQLRRQFLKPGEFHNLVSSFHHWRGSNSHSPNHHPSILLSCQCIIGATLVFTFIHRLVNTMLPHWIPVAAIIPFNCH